MRVLLVRSKELERGILDAVFEILIAVSGPLEFERASKVIDIGGDSADPLQWHSIFGACRDFRERLNLHENDFLVLLMGRRNEHNWFSSCDPQGARSIFIHAGDWESYVSSSPEYPVAFQVVENILQCLMFDNLADGESFFHDPPIGCFNDMCSWKPDIIFKLRTADVCLECLRVIKDKGIAEGILAQVFKLFELQRKPMLFRAQVPIEQAYGEFPFPIAITRRKISGTTEPFRKFLLLLDHFDSLVRCTVITCGCIGMRGAFHDFSMTHSLHERPSLGHWVKALRDLSNNERTGVPTLPTYLLERIERVLNIAEDAAIVSLRNERRGHGYCDCCDTTYKRLFIDYDQTVTDIERLLRPIYLRIKWCHTVSMSQSIQGTFAFIARDLTGDHPDFIERVHEIQPTTINDLPQTEKVYAITSDNIWYSLAPYIRYCDCPECGHHRVLVTDGEKYIDPYVGHRVRLNVA
jgi:hypothetical protein